MPTRSPWNSTNSGVHHNNTKCETGNTEVKEYMRRIDDRLCGGKDGKPLCTECVDLNQRGE